MDFLELAKKRYSVRKYDSRKVEPEKREKILEAGRIAPTAANLQPQRILAVYSEDGLLRLRKGVNFYGAPLAFVICSDHSVSWKRPLDGRDTADIDASIVTTHMMLEATDLGLGSIWICYFKPEIIKAEFQLPDSVEPINVLGVGYNAGEVKSPDRYSTERSPLEETVTFIP